MKKNKKGFSILEVLIGIMIFTLGLTGIYALLISALNLNEYSKNSIIASNLARESIEIIRSVRDSNYKNYYKWNKLPGNDYDATFGTGVYYRVENNFDETLGSNILLEKIENFQEGKDFLSGVMQSYKLCVNEKKLYTYTCNAHSISTPYYKYIIFQEVTDESGEIIPDILKLTSKVIWYKKGYHEVQIDTLLSDFLRQ